MFAVVYSYSSFVEVRSWGYFFVKLNEIASVSQGYQDLLVEPIKEQSVEPITIS